MNFLLIHKCDWVARVISKWDWVGVFTLKKLCMDSVTNSESTSSINPSLELCGQRGSLFPSRLLLSTLDILLHLKNCLELFIFK